MGQAGYKGLWARWVIANSAGELLGLGATFAIGAGIFLVLGDVPGAGAALLGAGLMTATGALEGVIVGLFQWSVLHRAITGVTSRGWIIATVIGAVVAWLFGSIPVTIASLSGDATAAPAEEPSQAVVLLLAAALGLGAGLILSSAQFVVLRRFAAGAWRWLPANAIAWAVAMPLIFAGADLAQRTGSVPAGTIVMAASIALAGAVAGAIHGIALVALAAAGESMDK